MPGIVGIIGNGPQEIHEQTLRCMVVPMLHESFYTSGVYSNSQHGLHVGWVNLGGSYADCMPVWNERNDICLIFSGEHFADVSEIEYLKAQGHHIDRSNASYLVHLYEEFGSRFFECLNGRFSGIVIDLKESKIVLFNDRYGLGRVYYHEKPEGFYFSSEAKSLLKVLPELRHLDPAALAESFSFGCVLQNRTLFSRINLLPGGARWTFRNAKRIKKESYFCPSSWEKQQPLSASSFYFKLKETFANTVPRYFRGQARVGMSLTGGVDGRMIMAWARPNPGELPCYTFGSLYRENTDVNIGRKVAGLCRQPHQTITVGPEFFPEFPVLAEKTVMVSDGTMDVTGAVEIYVNRLARKIAPVRLTGNYGGEILRGGVAFRPGSLNRQLLDPEFARLVQNAVTTYNREREGHRLSFIAFKQVPWHHYSRLSVEQSQLTPRSPYLDNDLVALVYQAPVEVLTSKTPSLRLIADGNPELARVPTDRGLAYPALPFITKLQHLYQEFTFKAEYAYDYGMPHELAQIDNVFAQLHLEKLFLGRHKFYHFRIWYRDKFASYLKEILLDPRSLRRPYINRRHLERIIDRHTRGYGNHTLELTRVLTSELIHRKLIEQ